MKARSRFCILAAAYLLLPTQSAFCQSKPDSTAAAAPVGDKWALVVGISKFEDSTMNLTFPAKDAKDFAKYLTETAGFAPDHVKVLINEEATRERILSNLGDTWLPRVALSDDLVVVFISSHGSPSSADIAGLNYLVSYNTSPKQLYATGIPIQELCRIIRERVRSKRVVLVLDACHSGAVNPAAKGLTRQSNFSAEEIAQGTGQLVICSSEPGQTSWESQSYSNSVFTRQLIDSLKQNQSTTGIIGTFNHLRRSVEAEVARDRGENQTPVMKNLWSGPDISLAVKPSDPRPGIRDSLDDAPTRSHNDASTRSRSEEPPPRRNDHQEQAPPQPQVAAVPPALEKPGIAPGLIAQPGKYAVLPFSGPVLKDVKGWQSEKDLPQFPPLLQKTLSNELASKFGRQVASVAEVNVALANSGQGSGWVQELGLALGVRYLIGGTIEKVSWHGKVMTGNEYKMTCSVQVLSVDTGQPLWCIRELEVKKTSWVKDQAMGMGRFFQDEVTPEMAEDIARSLSKVIPK